MRFNIRYLLVLQCVIFVLAIAQEAESQNESSRLDYIRAALEAADSASGGIRMKVGTYIGVDGEAIVAQKDKVDVSLLYMEQGDMGRWELDDYEDGSLRHRQILVFDGVTGKGLTPQKKGGSVKRHQPNIVGRLNLPHPTRIAVWNVPLIERLREDEVVLLPKQETVEGSACYVLEGRGQSDDTLGKALCYRIYIDKAIGYMPRQIEEYVAERYGQEQSEVLKETKTLSGYELTALGTWFPVQVTELTHRKSGEVKRRNVHVCESLEVGLSLDRNMFDIEFPAGTYVFDETTGLQYTVGASASASSLDIVEISDPEGETAGLSKAEPSGRAAKRDLSGTRLPYRRSDSMIYGAGMCLLLLVFCWVVRRVLKVRRMRKGLSD